MHNQDEMVVAWKAMFSFLASAMWRTGVACSSCVQEEQQERHSTGKATDEAAVFHVIDQILLKRHHVVFESCDGRGQFAVLAFNVPHLVLQSGDLFQLSLPTLGRRDPVPQSFAFQFNGFLFIHVHWPGARVHVKRFQVVTHVVHWTRPRFLLAFDAYLRTMIHTLLQQEVLHVRGVHVELVDVG